MALIIVLNFVVVCALVIGAYWLFVVRPGGEATRRFAARVGQAPAKGRTASAILKAEERLSHLTAVHGLLARAGAQLAPLQRTATEAGVRTTVGTLLLMSGCLALAGYLAGVWASGSLLGGLLLAVPLGLLPYFNLRRLRARRLARLEEQLPDAVELIGRALRAGHAFSVAFGIAAEDLPAPLGAEFKTAFDQQNYGMPLEQALRALAARVPLIDLRFFVTAVLTQRDTGGNLAEVLDKLASIVRERFRVKRQVRVVSAHGRMTGWILSALPPAMAVAFFFINPAHLRLLTDDPLGQRMLAGAVALQIIGALAIRRLVRVEY